VQYGGKILETIYSIFFVFSFLLTVFVLRVLLPSYVYLLYYVCIAVLTLDAGLLVRSQYPEGPATSHLDTGFSWFPCVYKRMLRWFKSFQVATTCFSCNPPDLNFLVTFFSYLCTCKITTATATLCLPSRNRGTDLPILNPDAKWECMVKAQPRPLYPRNGVAVLITQEEGWAQG